MNYPNNGKSNPIEPGSKKIYQSLFRHFSTNFYRIENSYVYAWESDFFCQTKAGYSIEAEVKISRSDFFADFKKKDKHRLLASHKQEFIYQKGYESLSGYDYETKSKTDGPCTFLRQVIINARIPNRFYYAMPAGLVELHEVPDYAGVLWLHETKSDYGGIYTSFRVEREAKLLHKNKQDLRQTLLDKFYWQSINNRNKISDLRQQLKEKQDFIDKHLKGYQINYEYR